MHYMICVFLLYIFVYLSLTISCFVYMSTYVIEYEKRDHFAVKLIIQYKQLKFCKHYLLYINLIFKISITLARKFRFLY